MANAAQRDSSPTISYGTSPLAGGGVSDGHVSGNSGGGGGGGGGPGGNGHGPTGAPPAQDNSRDEQEATAMELALAVDAGLLSKNQGF